MSLLHRMLVRTLIPVFLAALMFFVLILQLLDLFANLWRYLSHGVAGQVILTIAGYYLPKCISYSVPVALLFAVAYTLGELYKNNELVAILGSGVSLPWLVVPFFGVGLLLSVWSFVFEDGVVIDTFRMKNELYRNAVRQMVTYSNSNVTLINEDASTVYQADYYNDTRKVLNGLMIVRLDEHGRFSERLDADWAEWKDGSWELHSGTRYRWKESENRVIDEPIVVLQDATLDEPPATFRRATRNVEEMGRRDARDWVKRLRSAGLPFREALTEYYKKLFFPFSPLIVSLLAVGFGGRFKRNVLLMNLLTALIASVCYYVVQMVALVLAKNGYIPPLAGASVSFILFAAAGITMTRLART